MSPEDQERAVLLIFAGPCLLVLLIVLFLSLAGTNADPLGGPVHSGAYNWVAHARSLPTASENAIPAIFQNKPSSSDPLVFDTRPGGPPRDPNLLPPETGPSPTEPVTAAQADQQKKDKEARKQAQAKEKLRSQAMIYVAKADKLLKRNRYPQAKEVYTRAAKIDRSLKRLIAGRFYKKAKDQERRKSWSRAKLLYRMALHFDYANSKLHDALASTSRALGDKRKALEHQRLAEKFAKEGK
jgi:tetratricopeptide (TPR) repeat protein